MQRYDWLKKIQRMDPETEFTEIYRISSWYEFPWDYTQSLSFALYRTYAVPSIGRLLAGTGEFTRRTQKRYDDTVLILEAVIEHGFDSSQGREAIRRMNGMHRRYDISDADYRYVLSTFVVTPKRWMDDYGWRRLSPTRSGRASTTTASWAGTWAWSTSRRPTRSSSGCSTTTSASTSPSTRAAGRSPTRRSA